MAADTHGNSKNIESVLYEDPRLDDRQIVVDNQIQATDHTARKGHQKIAKRSPFTDEQVDLAERRASVCVSCEHSRGVSRHVNGYSIYIVKCEACGCGGLSLVHGTCRAGRWPEADKLPSRTTRVNLVEAQSKLRLRSHLSPGDVVTLTAAVRDLHRAYPGQYLVDIETSAPELWDNNPHRTRHDPDDSQVRNIAMHYPLIQQSNQRPVHFLQGYVDHLSQELGVPIPVTEFRGDIHLSDQERSWTNQVEEVFGHRGRFWIMMAGGKHDYTAKWWPPTYYQRVVDHFRGRLTFVQCGETSHWHPPLDGVLNLIGKTTIRQFVRLVYHAEGVVCPVTFAMHLAAAVPLKEPKGRLRPCVVIAGGREPPHWEAYPGHQFLHTVGQLPCCATGGCWRSRCQTVGDGDPKDRTNLCERPVQVTSDLRVPQCMTMIRPEAVIEAIERYLVYYSA